MSGLVPSDGSRDTRTPLPSDRFCHAFKRQLLNVDRGLQ